jgi:hypothetical protein
MSRPPPEAAFSVWLRDDAIRCRWPNGEEQAISFADLRAVYVETNDSGPWGMDVWFVLEAEKPQCWFPLGATGESEVLARLNQLPGFELQGMNSTANARFLCWTAKQHEAGA